MAHFYLEDGTQIAYVPYAGTREGQRPATLADARKHYPDWKPSTTTVLGERDKPQLNDWRVVQALKAMLDDIKRSPGFMGTDDEYIAQMVKDSEAYRDWAASFGTAVHDGIATAFKTRGAFQWNLTPSPLLGVDEIVEGFLVWADANALVVNESELSFSSSLGWGGTIDGLGTFWGRPCIFDYKTQDWGAPGDKNKKASLYDPEWPLQLASYAIGYGVIDLARVSFVISRTVPGLVYPYEWPDNARYEAGWLSLWQHWKSVHKWDEWAPQTKLELLQGGLSFAD